MNEKYISTVKTYIACANAPYVKVCQISKKVRPETILKNKKNCKDKFKKKNKKIVGTKAQPSQINKIKFIWLILAFVAPWKTSTRVNETQSKAAADVEKLDLGSIENFLVQMTNS